MLNIENFLIHTIIKEGVKSMLVMKLVHNNDLDFVKELQELRELLKKKNITMGIVESGEGSSNIIKIICDNESYNDKIKNTIYLYISNILYLVVVKEYRRKELFNYLMENYFFLKQSEIMEVEEKIVSVLQNEEKVTNEKMFYCINKINCIIEKIKECLEENEVINIKGFITFRMKELREDIECISSTSFDVEYIITKIIPEIDGVTGKFYLCSQHIVIPTIGIHNVYNALAAFVVGITLGIDSQKSADALSNYVPAGMRQKSVNVGGIISIEDCYNASPDSMNAAIKTLANTKANKKIAVLGDMLELGDYSKKAHYEVGQAVADNKIDYLLAFGNDAKYIIDGAKENGMKNAFYFNNKEELSNKLFELANKGDAVIFKASRGMKLEDIINNVYDRWEK